MLSAIGRGIGHILEDHFVKHNATLRLRLWRSQDAMIEKTVERQSPIAFLALQDILAITRHKRVEARELRKRKPGRTEP